MAFGSSKQIAVLGLTLAVVVKSAVAATNTMPESHAAAPSPVPAAKTSRPQPQAMRTPKPVALPANVIIPRYPQGPEPFRDGETLIYDASWEGIPAAEARITITHNRVHPDWWTGQMWINSSKVVDPLYRMRDYFREDFGFRSWLPDSIQIQQHEKSRRDRWDASFNSDRTLITAVRTNKQGRTWMRSFTGGAPWGPFSGAMMALSQPLRIGKTYTFDVFSGGNRYVFSFDVVGRERITTGLGTFNVLKIQPSVVWLSEGSFRDQATEMTVWLTDDPRHLPIRIESAVFIGSVVADLTQISQDAPNAKAIASPTPAVASTPTN